MYKCVTAFKTKFPSQSEMYIKGMHLVQIGKRHLKPPYRGDLDRKFYPMADDNSSVHPRASKI